MTPLHPALWVPALLVAVIAGLVAFSSHRSDLDRRRDTVRALRRLQAAVDLDGGSPDTLAIAVRDVLGLHACRFEPHPAPAELPRLDRDGAVTELVQRRNDRGLVLPAAVALPVGTDAHFLLVADPRVGTTPEERLVAVLAGAVLAPRVTRSQT